MLIRMMQLFEERKKKIIDVFSRILTGNYQEAGNKLNDLNENYNTSSIDTQFINNLICVFDFPVDKEMKICFHSDSVVLCYNSGYYYQGEEIIGERMFFYYDTIGMEYLKNLLIYVKCSVGKCSSCINQQKKQK